MRIPAKQFWDFCRWEYQIWTILQRRIYGKYWQSCRREYFRNVGKLQMRKSAYFDSFAEENVCQLLKMLQRKIFSKYWQVSDENTCQTIWTFLQMRIPTMVNPAEENIWQILAMLQRRIVAKYWAKLACCICPEESGGEYQIRGSQVSWWPGWGLRGPSPAH